MIKSELIAKTKITIELVVKPEDVDSIQNLIKEIIDKYDLYIGVIKNSDVYFE